MANTPQFDALINHTTGCAKCHAKNDIYCNVGRELWIDDKASSIANFDDLKTRQFWINDAEKSYTSYSLRIKQKVIEFFNRKIATNDKRGLI